ncbi:MAG: 30S ribosomal protein S12 methylthiotransferase RimO [Fervidobacterium sp.]
MKRGKVSIISLGCPKNLVDSERIAGRLLSYGYDFSFDSDKADYIVINTCAFLSSARNEAEEVISEFADKKRQGSVKKIIVAGCYASFNEKVLKKRYSEIDAFISTNNLSDIVPALEKGGSYIKRKPVAEMLPRIEFTLSHYEYLKIADGCNHKCTFCLIPVIKGRTHSFRKEFLIKEARALAENGVKELIIIAQDVTQYGLDLYGKVELIPLLEEISSISNLQWIRLMYTYPSPFAFELLDYMKSNRKIVPYIDMPFQHISDRILKKMKRASTRSEIEKIVLKIKEMGFAFRTSVIVGFPYETDEDFEELNEFILKYEIDHLGVFEYSNEARTESYKFPQVDEKIKLSRFNDLLKLKDSLERKRIKNLKGKTVEAIVDYYDEVKNASIGRTVFDAPEIDDIVVIDGFIEPSNIYKVKISGGDPYLLKGSIVRE